MRVSNFVRSVYDVVRKIPRGEVWSYGAVAKAAGSPRAARAVGNVLKKNRLSWVPCHRVVGSDGKLREFNRGITTKIKMLRREGVEIDHVAKRVISVIKTK